MSTSSPEPIRILWSFDDPYAASFAALVTSIREHLSPGRDLEVILAADFLSSPLRERLERWIGTQANTSLRWLQLDTSRIADAPLTMHFTRAAYARILGFEALDDLARLLYFDADMICLADIEPLWNEPLEGKICAAVLDPHATFTFDGHTEALGLPRGTVHFNSGMMLVDLEQWRREDYTNRCLRFIRERASAIRWVDQDVLNAVLPNWRMLASSWNAQTHFYKTAFFPWLQQCFPAELAAAQSPKIVHFSDPEKPWHAGFEHPLGQRYHEHAQKSGWEGVA